MASLAGELVCGRGLHNRSHERTTPGSAALTEPLDGPERAPMHDRSRWRVPWRRPVNKSLGLAAVDSAAGCYRGEWRGAPRSAMQGTATRAESEWTELDRLGWTKRAHGKAKESWLWRNETWAERGSNVRGTQAHMSQETSSRGRAPAGGDQIARPLRARRRRARLAADGLLRAAARVVLRVTLAVGR